MHEQDHIAKVDRAFIPPCSCIACRSVAEDLPMLVVSIGVMVYLNNTSMELLASLLLSSFNVLADVGRLALHNALLNRNSGHFSMNGDISDLAEEVELSSTANSSRPPSPSRDQEIQQLKWELKGAQETGVLLAGQLQRANDRAKAMESLLTLRVRKLEQQLEQQHLSVVNFGGESSLPVQL
jgi:hypothetical protein